MERPNDSPQNRNADKAFIALSVLLYLASLTQDAYYIDGSNATAWASSWWLVVIGWLGMFIGGGAALAWLANPLLILSWSVLMLSRKIAALTSVVATMSAASFLLFDSVISSEAPTYSKIIYRGPGYWLWLSSCSILTLYFMYSWIFTPKIKRV